jgi:hypothetical protein
MLRHIGTVRLVFVALILAQGPRLVVAGADSAGLQQVIYPTPGEKLEAGYSFRFSNMGLASGVIWDEGSGKFFYRDFALIMFYPGPGVARIDARISDDLGLDYRYVTDNLGRGLVIDGATNRKTCMLNVAEVVFTLSESGYEYHPNITVEVTSTEPIYTLPPDQFSTMGHGTTVREAVEEGWQHFGFAVPGIALQNLRYFMYSIFWRNLRAFPGGWDTKITLNNPAEYGISASLYYFPDYCRSYDPFSFKEADGPLPAPRYIYLRPRETVVIYLRQLLGVTLESSTHSEGSLVLELLRFDNVHGRWDGEQLGMTVEVLPLSGR